jgi:hypothetical protein
VPVKPHCIHEIPHTGVAEHAEPLTATPLYLEAAESIFTFVTAAANLVTKSLGKELDLRVNCSVRTRHVRIGNSGILDMGVGADRINRRDATIRMERGILPGILGVRGSRIGHRTIRHGSHVSCHRRVAPTSIVRRSSVHAPHHI